MADVPPGRRKVLDEYFPTAVSYAGLLLGVYFVVVDQGAHPVLLPFIAGMIGFKPVYGKRRGEDEE